MARKFILILFILAIERSATLEIHDGYQIHTEINEEGDSTRGRRDVIEEEKFYNIHSHDSNEATVQPQLWLPSHLSQNDDPTTKISITNNEVKEVLPLFQTTERVTDKPTGRGARASNDNWIKLPFPDRIDDGRDDILTPPQNSGDLINSRMPRIDFITQNKALEASESRNDKESYQRTSRNDDLRTEFVRPEEEDRIKPFKPVYPRQAVYYPEESRRLYYDDRYYPTDDLYKRDPYYDLNDRRPRVGGYFPGYGQRIDRFDEGYDNYVSRKPKRIIYYAHLPEVVRTPPSVDLRYRYDPHRRYEDDYLARNGRVDYNFRNRYPYAPLLRKEERNYRDLAGAGTASKDKKIDEKVTPKPIIAKKEDKYNNPNLNRNIINSHQYHDNIGFNYNDPIHKNFQDILTPSDGYLRYNEPLFQGTVEDPYQRKY